MNNWGFPQIWGTFFVGLTIKIIVFGDRCWVPPLWENAKCAQQADLICSTKSMINRLPVATGSVHRAVGIDVLAGMNEVGFSRVRQASIQGKYNDL